MRTRSLVPLVLTAAACVSERGPLTNRMAQATTGYLTRAARQPVGWQPWGRDGFALAAKLDRPVLLFVGGDECRWCTEMDRATYTDPEIASLINALFVPVRVDRDERPDVAQRYQALVQTLAGLRGYPLTVFLTPEGAAFFGGTYFPADDPVTGRGLKQILPEVARSYRDQRAFIAQHAALVRQLTLSKSTASPGVLNPQKIAFELGTVRGALEVAVRAGTALGSVMHAQAAGLLVSEFARVGDSTVLTAARAALDLLIDSAATAHGPPAGGREDPPRLVQAALLGSLARAWVVTGESRYQNAGTRLARTLARGLAPSRERAVFADRDAFVIDAVLQAASTFGDPGTAARARAALDVLLHRVYARGWGVRHAVVGSVQALLEDQVQVAGACLSAYQETGERRYLDIARDVAAVLERDFADRLGGYFDTALPDPAVPALADRTKQVLDDILPGANAWAARVLLRLAEATGGRAYRRRAEAVVEAFAGTVEGEGVRAVSYLGAAREVLATR